MNGKVDGANEQELTHTKTMKTENNEPAGKLSSGEDTNETAKTKYTEEEIRSFFLEFEEWKQFDEYDYRYFRLPDRARAHVLKYGSVGRAIMDRGLGIDDYSVQVYFGYRRALVAEYWPPGQDNGEDPNGSWELHEYRWKSEEGREEARLAIDELLQRRESEYGRSYVDTFFNDAERPLTPADIA